MRTQTTTHTHLCDCGTHAPTRRYHRNTEYLPHRDPLNPAVMCKYTGRYVR